MDLRTDLKTQKYFRRGVCLGLWNWEVFHIKSYDAIVVFKLYSKITTFKFVGRCPGGEMREKIVK